MKPLWEAAGGPPVVAFGGNALLPDQSDPDASERNAAAFAEAVVRLLPPDCGMVLVHGNGPQVGAGLLRVEAARHEVPPEPLDVLVAETQGSIGYLLGRALASALERLGHHMEVVTLVSQVVVDPTHPSMAEPSKPVGPFYPPEEGARIGETRGWRMVVVPGKGARRVVPSPPPIDVVELDAIRSLAASGRIVIAGGGGGVPVAREGDQIRGVEAVIDKDRTASLLGRAIDARGFLILTEVGHVSKAFGTEREESLHSLDVDEAQELLDRGEFPPGSMGPKVEACIAFARATGRPGVITSVDALEATVRGDDGTRIG